MGTALVWLQTFFYFKLSTSQGGAFNLIFIVGFYLGLNLVTFFSLKKIKNQFLILNHRILSKKSSRLQFLFEFLTLPPDTDPLENSFGFALI